MDWLSNTLGLADSTEDDAADQGAEAAASQPDTQLRRPWQMIGSMFDNINERILSGSVAEVLAPSADRQAPPPSRANMVFRIPVVGVMGSAKNEHADLAEPLGRLVASAGFHLLTGGHTGVMESSSRGFVSAPQRAGLCMGVLPAKPDGTPDPLRANPYVELPIVTHLPLLGQQGRELGSRNSINILTSDVVVALPGGPGTCSEVELAREHGVPLALFLGPEEQKNEITGLKPVAGEPVLRSLGEVEAFLRKALADFPPPRRVGQPAAGGSAAAPATGAAAPAAPATEAGADHAAQSEGSSPLTMEAINSYEIIANSGGQSPETV